MQKSAKNGQFSMIYEVSLLLIRSYYRPTFARPLKADGFVHCQLNLLISNMHTNMELIPIQTEGTKKDHFKSSLFEFNKQLI